MKKYGLFIVFLFALGVAHGSTLTAVCKSPSGTTLLSGNKLTQEQDGFGSGMFLYSWEAGQSEGTIISQSGAAAGSVPQTTKAIVVPGNHLLSFIVPYEQAMWVHTIHLKRHEVMISRHVDASFPQNFLGGLYFAKCDISNN